jgi:hypothetical protein
MIALTQRSTGLVQMRHVSPCICTTFEKGANPTVVCDRGRVWPSGSRTQCAGFGGVKLKLEDAEPGSCHVRHPGARNRGVGPIVPDAPVSRFTLDLDGGNNGLLVNSINLCAITQNVNVQITAQNGKTANQDPVLQSPCAKKKRKKHGAHKIRRAH